MDREKSAPHPATVVQKRAPHPATVVQRRAPHPARVVQPRRAPVTGPQPGPSGPVRPPLRPATVMQLSGDTREDPMLIEDEPLSSDDEYEEEIPSLTDGDVWYPCLSCGLTTNSSYIDFWGWKCRYCTGTIDSNDPRLEPVFPLGLLDGSVICHILGFLDGVDLLNVRATSKAILALACRSARLQVPYRSQARLLTATVSSFKAFSKSDRGQQISKEMAFRESSRLYFSVTIAVGPAYLELFNEKYFLFTKKVRETLEPSGRLLKPQYWCPEINDAWILSHVHRNNKFRLMVSPSVLGNFWSSKDKRATAVGRELFQIWSAGYRPLSGVLIGDPLSGMGVLFGRTELKAIQIEDAAKVSKTALVDILDSIRVTQSNVTFPRFVTGYRRFCTSCGAEVALLWKNVSGWRVALCCNECKDVTYLS